MLDNIVVCVRGLVVDKRHIFALYKLLNNAFLENKYLVKRLYSSVGDHRVVLDTSQPSVTRGSGAMIAAVYHPLT